MWLGECSGTHAPPYEDQWHRHGWAVSRFCRLTSSNWNSTMPVLALCPSSQCVCVCVFLSPSYFINWLFNWPFCATLQTKQVCRKTWPPALTINSVIKNSPRGAALHVTVHRAPAGVCEKKSAGQQSTLSDNAAETPVCRLSCRENYNLCKSHCAGQPCSLVVRYLMSKPSFQQ